MIEAVVSLGLIGLGVSVWCVSRLARGIYRHRAAARDTSFLARLFAEDARDGGDDKL
jgi:hypothetical protein